MDQRIKRNTVCKNALIIALDNLWPHFKADIWNFSYKKHFLNVFQTYNYKHTKFCLTWNMFTYKKIKFFSSTYFLIFALNDLWPNFWPSYANSDWQLPLRLCIHAKYYVKRGLTNVLKNANKTKNMHLLSIRIANFCYFGTWCMRLFLLWRCACAFVTFLRLTLLFVLLCEFYQYYVPI